MKIFLRLGVWLIKHSGYHVHMIAVDEKLLACAKIAVAEAERAAGAAKDAGLYKRQQAMRVLSNLMPQVGEHDCANAIQVVLDQLKRS